MSKQLEELSDKITDTMDNLETISVFSRSGNTLENIMVYKTRIKLELSHLEGSYLDIMTYCHEEWKYFVKNYPNVEPEVLPEIKQLLRYDECINFFSQENIEKRKIETELAELKQRCKLEATGNVSNFGAFMLFMHIVFALVIIISPLTFRQTELIHYILYPLWGVALLVGGSLDKIKAKELFDKRKRELGYVLPTEVS